MNLKDRIIHKFTGNNIPIDGGNSKITKMNLDAQTKLLESTMSVVDNALNGDMNKEFRSKQYDLYRLMLFQSRYFCNLFNIKTEDKTLNRLIREAKQIAFLWGRAVIYEFGGIYFAGYIKEVKDLENGEITEMIIVPSKYILSQNTATINFKKTAAKEMKITDMNKVAILRWDDGAMGAWFSWLPFLQQQESLLQMLSVHGLSHIKKLNLKVSDPTALKTELKSYFDTTNPFTVQIGSTQTGTTGNAISVLEEKSNNSNDFIDYLEAHQSFYYDLLGRRYNSDDKKERNVTSEVAASQSNFDILESEIEFHTNEFVEQLSKIYTGEIVKEWELKEQEEQEQLEQQEESFEDNDQEEDNNDI